MSLIVFFAKLAGWTGSGWLRIFGPAEDVQRRSVATLLRVGLLHDRDQDPAEIKVGVGGINVGGLKDLSTWVSAHLLNSVPYHARGGL